jgi:hypothetical protein
LILRIREERRHGAVGISLYLQRHYQVCVWPTTILKIFHRHRVTRVSLRRYRPGPKPQSEGPFPVPGQSVQVDVKFALRVGRGRQRFYQSTAIDEATRYGVLRVYDYNNTRSALAFVDQVRRRLPFVIRRIQTDNDSSRAPVHLASGCTLGSLIGTSRPLARKSTARSNEATRPMRKNSIEGGRSEAGNG